MKLEIITKDLLHSLHGEERRKAIKKHHKWLKEVRRQDKRISENQQSRVNRFKDGFYRMNKLSNRNIHITHKIDIAHLVEMNKKGKITERLDYRDRN